MKVLKQPRNMSKVMPRARWRQDDSIRNRSQPLSRQRYRKICGDLARFYVRQDRLQKFLQRDQTVHALCRGVLQIPGGLHANGPPFQEIVLVCLAQPKQGFVAVCVERLHGVFFHVVRSTHSLPTRLSYFFLSVSARQVNLNLGR